MAKTGVKYNLETLEIVGIVQVSVDADLDCNCYCGEGMIEVDNDHPILTNYKEWHIKKLGPEGISLRRKPKKIREIEEKKEKVEQGKRREGQHAMLDWMIVQFNIGRKARGGDLLTRASAMQEIEEIRKKAMGG